MTGEPSICDSDMYNGQLEDVPSEYKNIGYNSDNNYKDIITVTNITDDMFYDISEEPTKKYGNTCAIELNKQATPNTPSPTANKRDLSNYTPINLKSRSALITASDCPIPKKQKTYQDKVAIWASNRATLSEQQQHAFVEQHKLKMEIMQENHDVELKMMAEKHKIEIENLQLKNEILQIQLQNEKKIIP